MNKNAEKAVNQVLKLREQITTSKYSEMFNFSIYNGWIKKQLLIPLKEIKHLLTLNTLSLQNSKEQINSQLQIETTPTKAALLTASKVRVNMRIQEIKKHIESMDMYIDKLS